MLMSWTGYASQRLLLIGIVTDRECKPLTFGLFDNVACLNDSDADMDTDTCTDSWLSTENILQPPYKTLLYDVWLKSYGSLCIFHVCGDLDLHLRPFKVIIYVWGQHIPISVNKQILKIFCVWVFVIWLYLKKPMYRPCDLDLWPMKVNYFLWIDYQAISVLYKFEIDISTDSREIKYLNIEKWA